MKILIKKVYYCGFCKKHGLLAHNILEHEKHCTVNPNRKCGFCGIVGLQTEFKIENIVTEHETHEGVIIQDDDCPACALAFVRQNKTIGYTKNKKSWDYKEAVKRHWKSEREDNESNFPNSYL